MEERAALCVAVGRLEQGSSEEATDWLLHWCLAALQRGTGVPAALAPRLLALLTASLRHELELIGEDPVLLATYLTRGRGLLHLLALQLLTGLVTVSSGGLSLLLASMARRLQGKEQGDLEDQFCQLGEEELFSDSVPENKHKSRRMQVRRGRRARQRSVLAAFPDLALEGEVGERQCENLAAWEPGLGSSEEEEVMERTRGPRLEARPGQGFQYYDRGDLGSDEADRVSSQTRLASRPTAEELAPASLWAVRLLLLELTVGTSKAPQLEGEEAVQLVVEVLESEGEVKVARLRLRILLNCMLVLR